jgi:hypothetical protein
MTQVETQTDRAAVYFVVALLAFVPVALLLPWVSLAVPGFAYATPIRRHTRMMITLWIVGGLISAFVILFVLGPLIATSTIHDGGVHKVN